MNTYVDVLGTIQASDRISLDEGHSSLYGSNPEVISLMGVREQTFLGSWFVEHLPKDQNELLRAYHL